MEKFNYHTHTLLCRHAGGTEADYVSAALNGGLTLLGFSDHAPYPDDRYGMRMEYRELPGHLERIRALRDTHRGALDIRAGLEIEYAPGDADWYRRLLEQVEYLLLGQHYFPTAAGEIRNTYVIHETGDTGLYLDYANSLAAGMRTGLFAAVAHPDLFFINDLPMDKNCEKACDIIVNAAAETGAVLEFNANGLRRGLLPYAGGARWPYPHPVFWEKVRAAGLPVIVNSDCHSPDALWDSTMEDAYALARRWGLRLTDRLPMYRETH